MNAVGAAVSAVDLLPESRYLFSRIGNMNLKAKNNGLAITSTATVVAAAFFGFGFGFFGPGLFPDI